MVNNRYLIATLVMKGDSYTKTALALGYSAKLTKTKAETMCMVTRDVSKLARNMLKKAFDRVVEVPYISKDTKPMKGAKQREMYQAWISDSYTKWNILRFDEYDKVLFMDADAIFIQNTDELFELNTPAATFSRKNSEPYQVPGIPNYFAKYKHGDLINSKDILESIGNSSFVLIGTTVLLKPNKKDYDNFIKFINKSDVFAEDLPSSISGPDELSLTLFYLSLGQQWKYVSQIYNMIPWAGNWLKGTGYSMKDVKVFHYWGLETGKFWNLPRNKYPDLEFYWSIMDILFEKQPYVKNNWKRIK